MFSFAQTIFKKLIIIVGSILLALSLPEAGGSQTIKTGVVTADKIDAQPEQKDHSAPLKRLEKDEDGSNVKKVKTETEAIHRKIKSHKAQVKKFTQQETSIISGLNNIDRSLNKTKIHVDALKFQLDTVKERIKKTDSLIKDLTEKINIEKIYVKKRLVALYKVNLLGKMHVLASADSIYELLARKKAMEQVLAQDEKILGSYLEKRTTLQSLMDHLNQQQQEKSLLESEHEAEIKFLSSEKEKRLAILNEIRNKKNLQLAAIESMKLAAKELDQQLASLAKTLKHPLPKKKIQANSFSAFKGLLNMPARGKILNYFGSYKNPKFNVKTFRSGIDIKADLGDPIHAVSSGHILYAGWFKGYGNMIIIDHGDNYYTVYAHAQELFKAKGDNIEKDEVIATIGDTGSMRGSGLYFEVRHHGKPLDPLKWLNQS